MTSNQLNRLITIAKMLAIIVAFLPEFGTAQSSWYISFGCKIGYTSGNYGEFVGGIEVSVTRWPENSKTVTGACLSLEQTQSMVIAHAGVEILGRGIGGSLGPSVVFKQGEHELGITGTLWTGLVLLPYLRNTWLPSEQQSFPEYGIFLKIPRKISGPEIRLGG